MPAGTGRYDCKNDVEQARGAKSPAVTTHDIALRRGRLDPKSDTIARQRSLMAHFSFGVGLYLSALLLASVSA